MSNVRQSCVAVSAAPIGTPQRPSYLDEKWRKAIRTRIYFILQRKLRAPRTDAPITSDAVMHKKLADLTKMLDYALFKSAKSMTEYADVETLESRIDFTLRQYRTRTTSQRRAAATPSSVGTNGGALSITPTRALDISRSTFQSGTLPPIYCTSTCGVSAGFSIVPDQQIQQSAGANNFNHQMVDLYQPHMNQIACGVSSPLITGVGFSRNCPPLAANRPMTSQELFSATHLPTLSQPFLQPPDQLQAHMHRYSVCNVGSFGPSIPYGVGMSSGSMEVAHNSIPLNPNPMLRVDPTFSSNQSNLQQTPFPQRQLHHPLWNNNFQSAPTNQGNLTLVSRQLLNQQARDNEHQGQHSQKLHPGQLQKQDRLLNKHAYLTQQATGLASPVTHGLSLDSYKEAIERQPTDGFKPMKLQYQQTAVKDLYKSASIHTSQLNSSPSFRPHPHQKQSASVPVQRQQLLIRRHLILSN